jgi:starch-binding outer membrane protein, SusD/RagB family
MRTNIHGGYTRRLLLVLGVAAAAGACNALLDVTNPATFGDDDLNDPLVAPMLASGVVQRFQANHDLRVYYSAIVSDEGISGHNFETRRDVNLRKIPRDNSADVYNPLALTRALADSFDVRIQRAMGDSAGRNISLARIRAYGGLTYALMGEFLCRAPVHPTSDAVSPDSLFRLAIARSQGAIEVGEAFKAAGGFFARGDSLINMARVTAARAHLNLGENAQAAALAAQVPAAFEMHAHYNDDNANNVLQGAAAFTGTNRYLGVSASFRDLDDPRVLHAPTGVTGHDQRTVLFIPRLGASHSGWSPDLDPTSATSSFQRGTSIRISSGLEARYIVAEAQGLNAANVDFVNERREVGGQEALVDPTEAEYRAALRDQRRRDFFLDGRRLGDLRRYKRTGQGDYFPTGQHPTASFGEYGTDECFVPSFAEEVGNPGYNP